MGAIGQEQIGQGALVLVLAVRLERDFFPEDQGGRCLLGSMAVSLALLGAVDATEANAFGAVVVQHFECVAVEDGDDGAVKSAARAVMPNASTKRPSILTFHN